MIDFEVEGKAEGSKTSMVGYHAHDLTPGGRRWERDGACQVCAEAAENGQEEARAAAHRLALELKVEKAVCHYLYLNVSEACRRGSKLVREEEARRVGLD